MSKLKVEVDTHTHTVLSGHAYGTLKENAQAAFEIGLKGFVCADHGPDLPGAPPAFTISGVLVWLPKQIEGVRMFCGAEANIIGIDGKLDIADNYLEKTEFVIASLHTITFAPKDREKNTAAVLGAIRHPAVDCIGHPGNPRYPIDYEALVLATKNLGKVLEINAHSFGHRRGSEPNCRQIIRLCMKHDVPICVSSDAHSSYSIGYFGPALAVLEDEQFPQELILNGDYDRFSEYVQVRRQTEAS